MTSPNKTLEIFNGLKIVVPNSLGNITAYVLEEQRYQLIGSIGFCSEETRRRILLNKRRLQFQAISME